jgi:hypothetical protein
MSEIKPYYDTLAGSHYSAEEQAAAGILLTLPGTDPAQAGSREQPAVLPETGYLVTAEIDVAMRNGYVRVQHFTGGIDLRHRTTDTNKEDGYLSVGSNVAVDSGMSIIYSWSHGPDSEGYYVGYGEIRQRDAVVTQLSDNRMLVADARPQGRASHHSRELISTQYPRRYSARVQACRVVETPDEATVLLQAIGQGMRLEGDDLATYDRIASAALEIVGDTRPIALGQLVAGEATQ